MPESLDPPPVDPGIELRHAVEIGPPPALTSEFIGHLGRLLETNPEAALRMQIARRANLPFSEVVERWSMEDLAWEYASARQDVDNARHRCPGCGIDSRDQLTHLGQRAKLGDNPAWRLEVRSCPWCEERDETQAKLAGETYKRPPPQVHYVPALPGEPFFDDSSIPRAVPVADEGAPQSPQEPPDGLPASDLG